MSRYAKPMSQILANMQEAKKITKKERDKLEDDNQHGELALRLAQSFGTPQEVKKIKDINKRHMQKGSIDPKDQKERDAISNKYYKMAEGLDEGYESEVLKVLDDAGIDGYFRNGKLYVDKRDAKDAKSALEDADNIIKLPKMVKEEVEDLDEMFDYVLLDKDNKIVARASGKNAKKEMESSKKSAHLPPMRIPKGEVSKMKVYPISPKDKKDIGDMVLAIGEALDPADIDLDATDADKKAADKNMVMQMRKAMDVKGNMKIEFGDGKKEKVDPKILQLMITAHGKIQKPRDKEKFVAMISKSKRDMLMVAKKLSTLKMELDKEDEPIVKKVVQMLKKASGAHASQAKDLDKAIKETLEIKEGTWKYPDNDKEVAALKKLMSRPIPIGNTEDEKMYKNSANGKLYGLLGDDELFDALGELEDEGNPKADARPTIIKWFQKRAKDKRSDLAPRTKELGKQIGLKMEYIPEGFSPKEIKMAIGIASDPRYKQGNYTGAFKAIEKIKKGLASHPQVAAVLKRQNESNRIDNFDENYRKLAMKGIGTETKKAAKVGLKTDYYLPKNGDKSFGKITRVSSSGYEITDEKTKKVYKFKFYDPNNDPTSVRGTREEVELDEKVKEYKGVAYFKTRKDAEAHMKKFAPKGRVVEYERGYAVQTRISGPYLNKAGKTEEVELDEALSPQDKKVVDTFYHTDKSMTGKMLKTDGKTLEKIGMGAQTIAKVIPQSGGEFKVVAKMDSRSTQEIVNYIKKTFPKQLVTYEEVELDEKYDLYHKSFSDAMQHAYDYAKKKLGITVDPKEIDNKVATGPKKPSEGKTNKYRLKGKGGNLQIQVYNKGGSKPFELNMYKEENEMTKNLKETIMDMWKEASEGFASDAQRKAAFASGYKEKGKKKDKDEGNAFTGALKAAKEKGEKTFTVAGKTYDVKTEKLVGGQKKLDKDKDGDIDGKDFAMMRKKKEKTEMKMGMPGLASYDPTLKMKKKKKTDEVYRYHETKQGSLRESILQMWGQIDEKKIEYAVYIFKNEKDAKAAKAYFDGIKLMRFDINDDNIRQGELLVDAGTEDMTKYHKEVIKKFRPKVKYTEKNNLTKNEKDDTKKMTDTGKEVTPVETSVKMPKVKESKNKV